MQESYHNKLFSHLQLGNLCFKWAILTLKNKSNTRLCPHLFCPIFQYTLAPLFQRFGYLHSRACAWQKLRTLLSPSGGGGHSYWKGGNGTCRPQDPLFQAKFQLRRPYFSGIFPATEPTLGFFEKKSCISRPISANFLLLRHSFQQKISSGDPSFKPKNQFRRPYF